MQRWGAPGVESEAKFLQSTKFGAGALPDRARRPASHRSHTDTESGRPGRIFGSEYIAVIWCWAQHLLEASFLQAVGGRGKLQFAPFYLRIIHIYDDIIVRIGMISIIVIIVVGGVAPTQPIEPDQAGYHRADD